MHYIILDLEWNNTYARRIKKCINEVIEIGAVMLDDDLNEIDEFSCFVKAQIGKKLRSSVKNLTSITNEDLKQGIVFTRAMSKFRDWVGSGENVVLTWGDADIRVLIDNFKYLNGIDKIPFLSNYANVQSFVQQKLGISKANQLGLSNAAEMLGIDETDFFHHRALDDSKITAEIFKKTFSAQELAPFIMPCSDDFYIKLSFKPYAISSINSELVDRSLLSYTCEKCNVKGKLIKNWRYSNQYFRAIYKCPKCGREVKVAVRFKKFYDHIETKKNISIIEINNGTEENNNLQNTEQN